MQHHPPPSGGLKPEAKSPFMPQDKSLVPEPRHGHAPMSDDSHQQAIASAKIKESQERKRSLEKEVVEERIGMWLFVNWKFIC